MDVTNEYVCSGGWHEKLSSQSLSAALELDENFVIVRLEDSGLAIKVAVCCPDHHPHTVEDCVCS